MICKTTVCRDVLGPSGNLNEGHPILMYVMGIACLILLLYTLKRVFFLVFGTKGVGSFFGNIGKIALPLAAFFVCFTLYNTERNKNDVEADFSFIKDPLLRSVETRIATAQDNMSVYKNENIQPSHTLLDILNGDFVKRNGGTVVLQVHNDPASTDYKYLSENSTLTFTSASGESITVPVKIGMIFNYSVDGKDGVYSKNLVKEQTVKNPSIVMDDYDGMIENDADYKHVTRINLKMSFGGVSRIPVNGLMNDQIIVSVSTQDLARIAKLFDKPSDPPIVMR